MNIQELLASRRSEIMRIAQSHGATRVRLFGSVVSGTFGDRSDIDVIVTMRPGASLLDLVAIKQDLEDVLHRRVDVVTEDALSPYIRDEALKKAVNL